MPRALLLVVVLWAATANAQPYYLAAGEPSDLPLVVPNDNRIPAGTHEDGVLSIDLEVVEADFRPETPDRPGVRVLAFRTPDGAPRIPAPLIRTETGTRIRARVTNTLADSTITVFGLHSRPADAPDSVVVAPGATESVEFDAGEPGTYLYHARGTTRSSAGAFENEAALGALVVDPVGGSPDDRILVINIWSRSQPDQDVDPDYLETLTINGKSWPHTERLRPEVGEIQRWRVINGSVRNHPMHLHGFYFNVTDRATTLAAEGYDRSERRTVVTEFMRRLTTMDMEWTPTRPGSWVFHCHLAFHIAPETRLPGADALDHDGHSPHMAGLVMGIEIPDGPTDIVERSEAVRHTLYATPYAHTDSARFAFAYDPEAVPDSTSEFVRGQLILMRAFQPTYMTVENRLPVPTGVHWHGLELDAWSDGVPMWSASDGKMSPVIQPGSAFTYKLSALRPGTFIYHSHLDDVNQLTRGLYGPLIVLDEDESYDPATDHAYILGWRTPNPQGPEDAELNGLGMPNQPDVTARTGEMHRIRVINIAPAGNIEVRMTRDDAPYPLVPIAKDGADLPDHQQVPLERSPRFGVGETADFAFIPTEPGTYTLHVGYAPRFEWRQTWTVGEK